MIKKITLDNIDLANFFGVQNKNLKLIKSSFPDLEITARGVTIKASGSQLDIDTFNQKMCAIIDLSTQKKISHSDFKAILTNKPNDSFNEDVILHTNSSIIKPKTKKQKMMIDLSQKNDLLFISGPAKAVEANKK